MTTSYKVSRLFVCLLATKKTLIVTDTGHHRRKPRLRCSVTTIVGCCVWTMVTIQCLSSRVFCQRHDGCPVSVTHVSPKSKNTFQFAGYPLCGITARCPFAIGVCQVEATRDSSVCRRAYSDGFHVNYITIEYSLIVTGCL